MKEEFIRTAFLLGQSAIEALADARVVVFGVGGVGGHAAEALVRSGVGHITLVDNDVVSVSNINRQIFATHSTVGRPKVDVAKERFLDINPELDIVTYNIFFSPDNSDTIDFTRFDYVVDAIDSMSGKMEIVRISKENGVRMISSMGAGNKLDPTRFEVADIYDTSVCPLAKMVRKKCREMGIDKLKVVYSKELPVNISNNVAVKVEEEPSLNVKKNPPGSCAFVPSVAGLIIAGEVIKDLTNKF